ncbi:mucin-2-like [Melanaphis sacchari]|uniref:mucin-2-like n=1 Tax=Melanaphis sacchari TaxID=742174 RepID=UPI000DC1571D|nr:mucin-2-like [Melanaphis sacchari]
MKWFKVISTPCILVFVSLSYFTQCSGAPPITPSRSLVHNTTKPIFSSKCAPLVRCVTPKSKVFPATTAVAAALADFLKTVAGSSDKHKERPTTLHQFPDFLRTFVRFIGIVALQPSPSSPPTPPTTSPISDESDKYTTTLTTATTPSSPITTCPPSNSGSLKKLMSLFVPEFSIPSSTARPSSNVLPKLFQKADSYHEPT